MQAAFPLGIVIASGVVYHLAQKGSGVTSPWRMLTVAYGAAFAICLALALTSRAAAAPLGNRERAAGLLVGLAALGIEAGYFFIYRAGWPLATASVIASVTGMAILATVGVLAFGESLSALRVTGLGLAALAAVLIAKG